MSLYVKCPNNSKQQEYVDRVVGILRRDYNVRCLEVVVNNQTCHYYMPIPEHLNNKQKATLQVLMSKLHKRDPQITTGVFDMGLDELKKAVEEGRIKS